MWLLANNGQGCFLFFFTCREACLDVLLKARSFFIWGLVKRWGWAGSPWSGVSEWLHSSCSRTGAFTEEFVRRLSSGIWQEFKEAFCHSRVILYPAASWSRQRWIGVGITWPSWLTCALLSCSWKIWMLRQSFPQGSSTRDFRTFLAGPSIWNRTSMFF